MSLVECLVSTLCRAKGRREGGEGGEGGREENPGWVIFRVRETNKLLC